MNKDPKLSVEEIDALLLKAHAAGERAAKEMIPMVMVVTDGIRRWHVSEGACGFAWIKIRPGNSRLARRAKKLLGAHTSWNGGVDVWVRSASQSVDRKTAFANAFADVLRDAGFSGVFPQSRMD